MTKEEIKDVSKLIEDVINLGVDIAKEHVSANISYVYGPDSPTTVIEFDDNSIKNDISNTIEMVLKYHLRKEYFVGKRFKSVEDIPYYGKWRNIEGVFREIENGFVYLDTEESFPMIMESPVKYFKIPIITFDLYFIEVI